MVATSETIPGISDYAEIARRPLEAEQCALVVIDIQEKLLPPIFQKEQLVRNSQLLIRAAHVLKIPTLVSTQYAKGLGTTVPDVAALLPGVEAVDKTLFSCFGSDVFCSLLKRLPGQRSTLLLCGSGEPYLRGSDGIGGTARRLSGPHSFRCSQFPHRVELEDWSRSHACGGRGHLVDRDDRL